MVTMKDLTVKDENIEFYEIEKNDNFDESALTDEEKNHIKHENDDFENGVVRQVIIHRAITSPCTCQAKKIMQRQMRRASIAGPVAGANMQFTQEDIDNYYNGVIVLAEGGIDKKMLLYARQFKNCKNVEFNGDIRPMMRGLAQFYCDFLPDDEKEAKQKALDNAMYIMEDIETGEKTPADSLGEALFGKKDASIGIKEIKPE